jgi:prepilin-type N-terminal cleavage/methylation domain-containing protein
MQRPDAHPALVDGARGFTLLEVVVVLVIVGMTSAIVFPRLATMAASFEFAAQRDTFERTLNGLPYQAYRENNDQVLHGFYSAAGRDERSMPRLDGETPLMPQVRMPSAGVEFREHLPPVTARPAAIPIPEGWEVVVSDPIYFRGSGYCSGGTVELTVGGLEYSYVLRPPYCRAELVDER